MQQAKIIRTNGKVEDVQVDGLSSMQEFVGGWIEALGVDEKKFGVSVYINEEGRLDELPINMACCMWLLQNNMYPALEYHIHGDVLVLGATDISGDSTSIPKSVVIPALWKEPSFEIITDKNEIEKMFGCPAEEKENK